MQGKVADKDNNPIELAPVSVLSQGKFTRTNLKGEYSLQLQSADSIVVKYSMLGYKAKTRVLRRPKGKQTLLVQLFDDNQLGEVVVEGSTPQHGTTKELDIKNVKNGATMKYTIVTENEANLKEHKISSATPIAKGLIGKKKGEIAEISAPNGKMEFEIVDITME